MGALLFVLVIFLIFFPEFLFLGLIAFVFLLEFILKLFGKSFFSDEKAKEDFLNDITEKIKNK